MRFGNVSEDLRELVGAELTGQPALDHRYVLERRLRDGSQCVVFLATRHARGGHDTVCVKVFRPSFAVQHPEIAKLALQKESVALARLNDHTPPTPFVVRLLDGGEIVVLRRDLDTELPFLVLEYVHGGPLGTTLEERVAHSIRIAGRAFPPARARRVLQCMVQGLLAVHEVGVVHRDLKPTNVLLCGSGDDELAKVADFGVARPLGVKKTFGAIRIGTPGYSAPEQFDASAVGPWSDVFSLAALAFYVIAGEDMFGATDLERMQRAFSGGFEPLRGRARVHPSWAAGDLLERLDEVLRKATARDLRQRILSVRELWTALAPLLRAAAAGPTLGSAPPPARTIPDSPPTAVPLGVIHRAPEPLGLRAVAFDPDGHAVAAGRSGLWYWEGSKWISVDPPKGLAPDLVRYLRRLGPSRWFAAGTDGTALVFGPQGVEISQRLFDGAYAFTAASALSDRSFTLAGHRDGAAPLLVSFLDGAWKPPVEAKGASDVRALSPAAAGAWHVVGADEQGRGLLLTYDADRGSLERWPIDSASLHAAATDASGVLYAVGAGGFAFRKAEGHPTLERVLSHRDLTVVTVDPTAGAWAAAVGRVVFRPAGTASSRWSAVWRDDAWASPFVGIYASGERVMAVADDGSIVGGHAG
jgi:serine/threonine protein kinase